MMPRALRTCLLANLVLAGSAAIAAQTHAAHDPHAAHRAALKKTNYTVSNADYNVPDVHLLDRSGADVSLRELLDGGDPVALNFIFTTCTTVCPVMTVTFAQMQQLLGDNAQRMQLVSISIDPEYDRPAVLEIYARQFRAGDNWMFLTGDARDIITVLQSFDSYTGAKMNHRPVTLLKKPDSASWVRIDGLANGESLAHEVTTRLLN